MAIHYKWPSLVSKKRPFWAKVGLASIRGLNNWLQVQDKVEKADALLVLAGGDGNREKKAAELYKQGVAPLILLTESRSSIQGHPIERAPLAQQNLVAHGVPPAAIECLSGQVRTTFDEARRLQARMEMENWGCVLLITAPLYTRRSRATFCRALRGSGVQIAVVPSEGLLDHQYASWEKKLFYLCIEYLKLIYYFLRGRLSCKF